MDTENTIEIKTFKSEKKFKRVCESAWHEEVELKPNEECPICFSQGKHTIKEIKDGDKNDK